MYARVLRKWSLTKVLMYLWLLPVIMLLVIYCQNATTMHINGIINIKRSSSSLLLSKSSSSSSESTSNIIIKKPATLPQLSSIIQEDEKIIQQKNILRPIDNDNQYYYNDDNDDNHQKQQQLLQQQNNLLKPLNKNENIPIISNYNHDDDIDDNYHQINQKNDDVPLIAENSAPILISVKTVSNANSISISDTINASANVPNLNSQIINLNNYNNINNNSNNNINNNNNNNNNSNNNYNSLTSSANIDTISSNINNNQNNRSNKFRRHIQQSRILSVDDNDDDQQQQLPPSSIIEQENLLKDQTQQNNLMQQSPPYHHLISQNLQNTNSQNLNSDRTKVNINNQSNNNNNYQHQQEYNDMLFKTNNDNREMPESFDQLSPQQERFYELRERRARIEAHRRRLIRLNQLPSTLPQAAIINNNNNSDIKYNRLLITTESTIIQKDIDSNGSIIELNKLLTGRNRRDSRIHPLHLSSVSSSVQPSYSHQTVLGSSSMTMLSVPSVQPSYSSYPGQSSGYYRQQSPQNPPLYQHYNTNNYNNMNYNNQNQQQNYQQHQNQHNNHQQYNNNNNQHNHQQQQQRKRPRRYCSARDPAQLAFEAPTVFEGKIISMSYDRRANFSVTFEVKEIFKKQIGYMLPHLLRLQFSYRNTSGECDIYREYLRPRGLVRGNELEQGRIYILFVQQIDLGNFTILGQPVRKTRRAVNSVRKGVSENYAQPAFIRSLTAIANDKRIDNDKRIKNGEELRIICRVSGQPPPKVTWFKDDKSINRNRKLYQFVHLKKRSELIIRSFNSTDAGVYECRAKNKNSRKPERKIIRIESFPRITYESSSQQSGDECTHDMQIYCLNGGTCKYFKEIHDFSCECPDGFYGDRCQEKQWNETPNPTFKTGYMADDPSIIFDSDEESITDDESV